MIPRLLAAGVLILCLAAPAVATDVPEMDFAAFKNYVEQRQNRPLLVNLWATWCAPCLLELPGLVALRRATPEDQLEMIGVSLDFDPEALAGYVADKKLNYKIFLAGPDLMESLGVTTIPQTLLYDASGLQIMRHEGYIAPGALCGLIRAHAANIMCGEK